MSNRNYVKTIGSGWNAMVELTFPVEEGNELVTCERMRSIESISTYISGTYSHLAIRIKGRSDEIKLSCPVEDDTILTMSKQLRGHHSAWVEVNDNLGVGELEIPVELIEALITPSAQLVTNCAKASLEAAGELKELTASMVELRKLIDSVKG